MKTIFQASVKLTNNYPEAKSVRVETREEAPPKGYRLAAAYLGLGVPPTVPVEYLVWELDKRKQVDLKAATDALLKVETANGLIAFMREWGSLFCGKEILLADALRHVWLFQYFAAAKNEGIPFPGPDVKTWTVWPLAVKKAEGGGMAFSFVPVPAKDGWPLFRRPKGPLGFNEDEEAGVYAFEELKRNALKRLRQVEICWEGKIVVKPSCLYDALLAALCLAKPRAIALGTRNKQDAITYFRTYKRRGKISEEEFEAVKEAISQAWDEGEDNIERLREVGWETLREIATYE